jgi:DNA primase
MRKAIFNYNYRQNPAMQSLEFKKHLIEERVKLSEVLHFYGVVFRYNDDDGTWRAVCPFERERTVAFEHCQESNTWKCSSCNRSGGVFDFISAIRGVSLKNRDQRLKLIEEILNMF